MARWIGPSILFLIAMFGPREGVTSCELETTPLRQQACNGHAEAQFKLASALMFGCGEPTDTKQAFHWLDLAVANGHAQARRFALAWQRLLPNNTASSRIEKRNERRQDQSASTSEVVARIDRLLPVKKEIGWAPDGEPLCPPTSQTARELLVSLDAFAARIVAVNARRCVPPLHIGNFLNFQEGESGSFITSSARTPPGTFDLKCENNTEVTVKIGCSQEPLIELKKTSGFGRNLISAWEFKDQGQNYLVCLDGANSIDFIGEVAPGLLQLKRKHNKASGIVTVGVFATSTPATSDVAPSCVPSELQCLVARTSIEVLPVFQPKAVSPKPNTCNTKNTYISNLKCDKK